MTVNFHAVEGQKSKLPDAANQPWPMGDVLPKDPLPAELDAAKVKQAVDAAFEPAAELTAAFVVTWKGRLIGERYGEGITAHTPLESWSMGKSVTATLMGILIKQGVYELSQPAPIPEWQGAGDPRAKIRIADILNMSSGLRIRAPQDPDYDPSGTYPDHLYLYTGSVNAFHYAATRPLQWPPGTVGRYHNTDPVLINYLIRLAVEKRGEEYLSFPQRALFDKIGIRTMVIETDPFGNLSDPGLRVHVGPRLGASRQPLSAGRRLERRADSARGVRQVREHAGAGVGGRQAPDLRRLLLDQRGRHVPGPEGGVLHVRRGRPDHADHSVARSRRRAPRTLQGQHGGIHRHEESAGVADGSPSPIDSHKTNETANSAQGGGGGAAFFRRRKTRSNAGWICWSACTTAVAFDLAQSQAVVPGRGRSSPTRTSPLSLACFQGQTNAPTHFKVSSNSYRVSSNATCASALTRAGVGVA